MPLYKKASNLKRFGAQTILIWTILIGTLLAIQVKDHQNETVKEATNEARDYFRLNLFYRAWASKMGGVYVPTDKAAPNAYLQVPNRDITTSDNRHLTLVNPAYMTRMVFGDILAKSPDPIRNKITSLKPLNPVNAPDEWEKQSLTAFDNKQYTERSEVTDISGKPYLRFISAFITDESCLKCHAHQGFKIGDVRGAIAISVPLSKRFELQRETNLKTIGAYGLLWLVGGIGIAFASNRRSRDEDLIQQEHARAHTYLETVDTMIVTLDSNGRISAVNRKACQVLGYREDELLGSLWFSTCLPHPEGMETIYPHFQKIMAGEFGSAEYHENKIITKNGELRLIAWHNSLLRNAQGQMVGTISAGDDITERKQMEEIQLFLAQTSGASEREPFFNALARFLGQKLDMNYVCIDRLEGDGLTASTVSVWHDGRFEDNVRYALKDTPCGDVVGKEVCCFPSGVCQLFPNDKVLQELRADSYVGITLWDYTGEPIGLIALIGRKPLESTGIIEATLKMIAVRAAGEIQSLIADELQRENERQIAEALAFNSSILNTSSIGILTYRSDGQCVFANKAAATIAGTDVEGLLAQNFHEIASWKAPGLYEAALRAFNTEYEQTLEAHVTTAFGKDIWLSLSFSSVTVKNDKHLLVFTQDITQRKTSEEALNKRLIALTQPLESGAVAFDELFNIDDLQRLQDEFAIASGVASLILSPDGVPLTAPSNFTRLCNDIIRTSEKGCANCRTSDIAIGRNNPDGPIIQPCLSGGLWDAGAAIVVNGQHIASWLIGQVRDETQTEEKMTAYAREIGADEASFLDAFREVPSMSRQKFEQIAQALFTLANQLSITAYQNIQQARFINERKQIEEAIRESNEKFSAAFNNAPVMFSISLLEDGTYLDVNQSFLDLSGFRREEVIGKTSIELGWMSEYEHNLLKDELQLKGGCIQDHELTLRAKNGQQVFCRYSCVVITISGNKCLLSIALDVTDRYKIEQQLQQAQKMESVGRLAGGVAHDFNNMLSVILGHAELGLMHLDPTHPVCNDLKEISKTAERSADLTRQLLAFARKQTVSPKIIDLNDTITNMLKMLQRLIGEDIHLTWQPSSDKCLVKMDPSQIDQILANLCVNARDAINNTGRITIETGIRTIDANYCAATPEASPGEYVLLSVSDDGEGMDRETLLHIFEPFYTTKEIGKGTGLGLATVYGAVKQNNGFINIYSEPGKGTTFSIYLPHYAGDTARKQAEDAAQPVPRGQETILLVEDEVAILNITGIMLEKQGYTVLRADSPGRAMELAREHHGEIHLLMTDVIMPEMNGRDLARNILALHPGIKRLFMSGYTADVIAHHGVLDDGVNFIQKPFSLPAMAAMVRKVLDGT